MTRMMVPSEAAHRRPRALPRDAPRAEGDTAAAPAFGDAGYEKDSPERPRILCRRHRRELWFGAWGL
jgi:hypothetical protein